MIFKEFGDKNMPVIILLHGGGLSWWSWKPQIEALQKDYCIVTPIIDGHGDAYNTPFVSIKKSAEQVIKYITQVWRQFIPNAVISRLLGFANESVVPNWKMTSPNY
ncbi:alpha/beta hydrolase [Desulfitobacterium sp.]|uniref:alpha/beta fold hydrolase n=1 Tax=Desulfitobacterium sp. TaxID=49981 RepID=UPI002B7CB6FE|nr:alpha/beta hydrolase [Desulfitobacterium sp.]HVJ50767.1 alpha/beta hydrolase [Desulfitobacterium sp.]